MRLIGKKKGKKKREREREILKSGFTREHDMRYTDFKFFVLPFPDAHSYNCPKLNRGHTENMVMSEVYMCKNSEW